MGILANTKTYLIGHMEFVNGEDWRKSVTAEMNSIGVKVFNPYEKPFINAKEEDEQSRKGLKTLMRQKNYDAVAEHMKDVRKFDLRLCDLADFLIINIVPEVASWGSAEEIYWVNRQKKPMFVSIQHPDGKAATPLWIMGTIPHKYIFDTVGDSVSIIKKIDSGEIPINSDRWRLLKPELR